MGRQFPQDEAMGCCALPEALAAILRDCLDEKNEETMAHVARRIGQVVEAETEQQPEEVELTEGILTRRVLTIHNNLGVALFEQQPQKELDVFNLCELRPKQSDGTRFGKLERRVPTI